MKIRDRFCLNYFVTDKSLTIPVEKRSPRINLFSSSEYFFMFPLFGKEILPKFQLQNRWLADYRANYRVEEIPNLKTLSNRYLENIFRNWGEKILDWNWLENFLGRIEEKRIRNNPKTLLPGSLVNVSAAALVFLPEPRGAQIFSNFKLKMEKMGIWL